MEFDVSNFVNFSNTSYSKPVQVKLTNSLILLGHKMIQEPINAAIWHCLNHYDHQDATFLAEKLCTEVESEETIFLLATCYYRSGLVSQAQWILSTKKTSSPQCRFLLAKCDYELKQFYEAEEALVQDTLLKSKSFDGVVKDFGEIACFAMQLLARICAKTGRNELAASAHRRALKLNPFLWQSYAELCALGEKVDPNQIFQFSTEMFQTCQSQNFGTKEVASAGVTRPGLLNANVNVSTLYSPSILTTPIDQNINKIQPNPARAISFDTPSSLDQNKLIPTIDNRPQIVDTPLRKQYKYLSPLTPSFGVMPLTTSPPVLNDSNNALYLSTPKYEQQQQQQIVVAKKIKTHKLNNIKRKDSPMPDSKPFYNHTNNITNVRRSSRLFSSTNYSVKENNSKANEAQNLPNNKFVTPKSPPRKNKQRIGTKINTSLKTSNLNTSITDLTDKSMILDKEEKPEKIETVTSQKEDSSMLQHVLNMKRESVEGLMVLLRELGQGFYQLSQYNCREAITLFENVAAKHQDSTWVQSMLALSHYELREYESAAKIFKQIHIKEPKRMHFMEIYSTVLWHLQKEVELSALAQDLMNLSKTSPVTWCVAGNCFSLHKEHDAAIKFFQRAVQVDPDFVYSYILLGHEFVITEDLEKALSCFRTAILKDFRHYNAWFGIGTIYSKQEKFQLAEIHYEKALKINPRNSVIMVHIGAIQLFSKQMDKALITLNEAIKLDPKNPLCKFNRGRLYFAMKKYEEALQELEELKEIVPKESVIYYLIGKIHKQMGNYDLGLMHFSWASDLDPKGANNQIKESFDNTTVGGDAAAPSSSNFQSESMNNNNTTNDDSIAPSNNNPDNLAAAGEEEEEAVQETSNPEVGGVSTLSYSEADVLGNNTAASSAINNTLQGIAELETVTPTSSHHTNRGAEWNLYIYDNDSDSF